MIFWIIFGLATSLGAIYFAPRRSSVLGTIMLGVLGAFLGGFLANILFASEQSPNLNWSTLLVVAFSSLLLVSLQRSILKD